MHGILVAVWRLTRVIVLRFLWIGLGLTSWETRQPIIYVSRRTSRAALCVRFCGFICLVVASQVLSTIAYEPRRRGFPLRFWLGPSLASILTSPFKLSSYLRQGPCKGELLQLLHGHHLRPQISFCAKPDDVIGAHGRSSFETVSAPASGTREI